MQIERAAVVGLGTMGAGIAEVLARSGLSVTGVEISDELLAGGRSRIERSLQRAVDRGKLSADDQSAITGRLTFTTDRAELKDVQLVVEAVPERLDAKTALFRELDGICDAGTVFATNTSSLPVTAIAASSGRPDRVVGMHFFNPAPVMRLVEVVSTVLTAEDARSAVADLARRCGKTPVAVGDRAGFVANTLLVGYLGHAARLIDAKVVSVADLDAVMTASCGLPMGPMRLLDLIGLDVTVEILRVLDEEFRSPRYAVAPLLRRLVLAGRLGVKSGEGFYRYDAGGARPAVTTGPLSHLASAHATAPGVEPTDSDRVVVVAVPGGDAEAVSAALGGLPIASTLADAHEADVVVAALGHEQSGLHAVMAASAGGGPDLVAVHLPRAPRPTPVVEIVVPHCAVAGRLVDSVASIRTLAEAAGRTVAVCKGRPGYAVEALLFRHLDDAARMVGDGYASEDDIDAAMTLGCGYPAGPFAMLAEVGAARVAAALLDPGPLLAEMAAMAPATLPAPATAQA